MKDIREQIYDFIDLYIDTTEPKKLCSSIQDLVEELAESKVKNLPMHGVSNCDSDTKDLIEHTKRVLDLIKPESGIAVKVLSNRINKKIEQLK